MPTEMVYSTTLRQINYVASWINEYIKNSKNDTLFEQRLVTSMKEFINELDRLNVLEPGLMKNEKHRSISLFGKDLDKKEDTFRDVYSTTYKASFAYLAQAQRHRTLDYQMEMTKDKKYFVPPILEDDKTLVNEWLNDIESVKDITPQGELVNIYEIGSYDNFILKCKERLCTAAQLEIMLKTKEILNKYKETLEKENNPLKDDIVKYSKGARCTFPDFECKKRCNFKEGITLVRKI
jgi:hypothetical protein